jgi:Zn-dependent protease with chaperone function
MAYVALIGTISFLMKGGIYIFLSTPLGQAAPLIALAPMVCLVAWSVYRRGEESAALRYASFLEQEGPSASRVNRLLEPLCAAQKLSVPLVRFDTSSAEHTASIAHLLGKPFILVNERVLDQMSDRELRAILAHELGHRNPFLRGMGTLARHALSTIPPLVGGVTLCWTMGVVAPKLGTIMGFLSWGVSFPLLSYGLGLPLLLCSRYISRKEEIMTDIRSCAATGDPEAMISVLYKLKAKSGYVVHGVRGAALLRTHPTEDARIQKLREVFGVSEVKETSNNAAPRSA